MIGPDDPQTHLRLLPSTFFFLTCFSFLSLGFMVLLTLLDIKIVCFKFLKCVLWGPCTKITQQVNMQLR